MLSGIDLGHDFAKQQQEESQQNGNHDELQPIGRTKIDDVTEEIIAEHDDRHVHQVVGNQDGGQCPLRVLAQLRDQSIAVVLLLVKLIQIVGRE